MITLQERDCIIYWVSNVHTLSVHLENEDYLTTELVNNVFKNVNKNYFRKIKEDVKIQCI